MQTVQLVEAAKGSSGCSFRELADRADLAVSTITRVTRGAIDPTIDTLAKILNAAGYDLQAVRKSQHSALHVGQLASAWADRGGRVRPLWNRWRALLDQLARETDLTAEAIYLPPPPAGNPIIDALLAAVAEKLADDAGLRRPSWTHAVPALTEPWAPPARIERHEIPSQFASRGLMIDAASLWREAETVGV